MDDPFDLQRFVKAQAPIIENVRAELQAGQKRTHWMWFVFPQIKGLSMSETSRHFSISCRQEAIAFLDHPILGVRLGECTHLVNQVTGRSAHQIFGNPDCMKFHSSMTLFADVAGGDTLFTLALAKYFDGKPDRATCEVLIPIL